MAKSPQDLPSKRQFHWTTKVSNEDDEFPTFKSFNTSEEGKKGNDKVPSTLNSSSIITEEEKKENEKVQAPEPSHQATSQRKKLQAVAVSKLRSVLTTFSKDREFSLLSRTKAQYQGLGARVVGTLFGHRRGHVHFAFQKDPNLQPAFLVELATPITGLVREMASGLVRIALECDKEEEKKGVRLLEETLWRTYCNGKKCGFATRRECGTKEWNILKAVEPISMGAGVLPGNGDGTDQSDCEIMYMRAKFERVVGSRDSEAFYMMNPDSNGAPELSIYLLRVQQP